MTATLHIIPFSHFNEKGMWILDYKGFEYRTEVLRDPTRRGRLARRSGGATTTPQLHVGDTVIADTTELALSLERERPSPALLPSAGPERTRCLMIEDWADATLGPDVRLWAFGHLREHDPALGREILVRTLGYSPLQSALAWPIAIRRVSRRLGIDRASIDAAAAAITRALTLVRECIERHPFLVGDRFTLADLAVASFLMPIVELGPWRNAPELASVFDWRRRLVESHGRRRSFLEPIPDAAERVRRAALARGA